MSNHQNFWVIRHFFDVESPKKTKKKISTFFRFPPFFALYCHQVDRKSSRGNSVGPREHDATKKNEKKNFNFFPFFPFFALYCHPVDRKSSRGYSVGPRDHDGTKKKFWWFDIEKMSNHPKILVIRHRGDVESPNPDLCRGKTKIEKNENFFFLFFSF